MQIFSPVFSFPKAMSHPGSSQAVGRGHYPRVQPTFGGGWDGRVSSELSSAEQSLTNRPPTGDVFGGLSQPSQPVPANPTAPARNNFHRRLPGDWQDRRLPEWFSQAAADAAYGKPLTSPSAEDVDVRLMTWLNTKNAPTGETYAELLRDLGKLDVASNEANYILQMAKHKKLPWFERLIESKPKREGHSGKSMRFTLFEERLPDSEERFKLFSGLCELHDRKLIRFSGDHPYYIWITAAGREALKRLPPEYPRNSMDSTHSPTPAKLPDYEEQL